MKIKVKQECIIKSKDVTKSVVAVNGTFCRYLMMDLTARMIKLNQNKPCI